jgi:hypothetical protein
MLLGFGSKLQKNFMIPTGEGKSCKGFKQKFQNALNELIT